MITVGPMELHQPQAPDAMEPFFVGGEYHTDMSRLSSHDHSGGLLGAPVAVTIPDGSITAADLDPSVLAPYALTDGSKPFTGLTTMQADAVVRDTLYFGEQGTALAPDVLLQRTAPGVVDVLAVLTATNGLVASGSTAGYTGGEVRLGADGAGGLSALTTNRTGAPVMHFDHRGAGNTGSWQWRNQASASTTRMALGTTGTLVVTPDPGQYALTTVLTAGSTFNVGQGIAATGNARLYAANNLELQAAGTIVQPVGDGTHYFGSGTARWAVLYAVAGAINTSSAEMKEGITPLDPLACYEAAKAVKWFEFAYLPPAYQEPEPPPGIAYDAADDNETKAEKKALRDEAEAQAKAAHLKLVAETAPARHQRGFVFPTGDAKDEAGGTLPPVPDLFGLADRESTTPQADIATLGAAWQELARRFEIVEAQVAALVAPQP